jgi:serine/threonine protein kinase/formylglycine-generating enzyme required for sulfatase activity
LIVDKIGPYKILEPLGHGAVGKVDKAQAPDGTIVAIKTLFQQFTYEAEYVKRFKQEARLAKKLSHPNVVKVLDVGEDDSGYLQYIVMEYVEGKTLAELMSGRSKYDKKPIQSPPKIFTASETIRIMRQISGVLQAAMDIGLLHRDIKPQNIMLDADDNAKLLDFGLSKDCDSVFSILSTTGQFIGTPPYMSPEQHSGEDVVDHRSDLYSLGCTAYQMLTGITPFPGPAVSGYAMQHLNDIPKSVHSLNKQCPKNLSFLINRLLAKKSKDRQQTPAELIEDLNRVERGQKPVKIHKHKKKSYAFFIWRVAVAAVLFLSLFWLAGRAAFHLGMNPKVDDDIIIETISKKENKPTLPVYENKLSEDQRLKKLDSYLRQAGRWSKDENKIKKAVSAINQAYMLCDSDKEHKRVATLEKIVYKALANRRPWVAVVDFTVDDSVESKVSGKAIAIKLEQALNGKFRLLTRSQVKKALQELRFQTSDLIDHKNAKRFGKLVGAELLLTGSIIQLGPELTVATQCFDVETGIILQTAEISMFNPGEMNAKLFDLAAILTLDKNGKENHLKKKIDVLNKRRIKYELAQSEGERVLKAAQSLYTQGRSLKDENDLAYKHCSDGLKTIEFFEKSSYVKYLPRKEKNKFVTLKQAINKYIAILVQGPIKDRDWTLPKLKMSFTYVKAGKFYMGSLKGPRDEKPRRMITLKSSYWLGKYEVSNGEYLEFIAATGYNGNRNADDNYLSHFKVDSSIPTGNNYPVCWISWHNADAFCKWLTTREKRRGRLPKGYVYRLPTEAEWEFAARGGNKSKNYKYSGSNLIELVAWCGNKVGARRPHEVGVKSPNELGLFDMSGNVWEFCYDWKGNYLPYYHTDPKGSTTGANKVVRGGGWYYDADFCRVTNRHSCLPKDTYNTVGFRVALGKEIK